MIIESKRDLSELLHECCDDVALFETAEESKSKDRIVYYPYQSEDVDASDLDYERIDTYQIDFYSVAPLPESYKTFRTKARELGIRPTFYHEFNRQDRIYHTYCAVQVKGYE